MIVTTYSETIDALVSESKSHQRRRRRTHAGSNFPEDFSVISLIFHVPPWDMFYTPSQIQNAPVHIPNTPSQLPNEQYQKPNGWFPNTKYTVPNPIKPFQIQNTSSCLDLIRAADCISTQGAAPKSSLIQLNTMVVRLSETKDMGVYISNNKISGQWFA